MAIFSPIWDNPGIKKLPAAGAGKPNENSDQLSAAAFARHQRFNIYMTGATFFLTAVAVGYISGRA
jgi:hypothetical protein